MLDQGPVGPQLLRAKVAAIKVVAAPLQTRGVDRGTNAKACAHSLSLTWAIL